MSANNVFIGLLKDLKARGMDQTTHKAAISAADMQKMYSSGVLSDDNPKSLQRKVFIELMLHFGRRGREGLRTMRRDSVVIKTDGSGTKYATMAYNELTKNHQSVTKDKSYEEQQPMMVAQANRCPIKSLELYMSKLNEQCEAFWQRPNVKCEGGKWYANRAVGINTLADMMKNISLAAELSRVYTNHSLRATSCTVLAGKGYKSRDICSVTGHRNETSIAPYVRRTPMEKRIEMSGTLHSHGAEDGADAQALVPTSSDNASNISVTAPGSVTPTAGPSGFQQLPATAFNQWNSSSWARWNFLSGANFYGSVTFNLGFDMNMKEQ